MTETRLIPVTEERVERLRFWAESFELYADNWGIPSSEVKLWHDDAAEARSLADSWDSGLVEEEADELCSDGANLRGFSGDKGYDDAQYEAYESAHRKLRSAFAEGESE